MSDRQALKANTRQAQDKADDVREQGNIPAVVYGHGFENKNVFIKSTDFERMYKSVGESTLVDLVIDDQDPLVVIIADIQRHPVKHNVIHADFHKVRMDEKIKSEISIIFVGESPAVKDKGGILLKALEKVEVSCLPTDLIHEMEVDLSALKEIGESIRVSDLNIPEKVSLVTSEDAALVLVEEPKKIEETPVEETESTEEGEEDKEQEGEKPAEATEETKAEEKK